MSDFPGKTLVGSEKQIAWAEKIRAERIFTLAHIIALQRIHEDNINNATILEIKALAQTYLRDNDIDSQKTLRIMVEGRSLTSKLLSADNMKNYEAALLRKDRASFWIDARHDDLAVLAEKIMSEIIRPEQAAPSDVEVHIVRPAGDKKHALTVAINVVGNAILIRHPVYNERISKIAKIYGGVRAKENEYAWRVMAGAIGEAEDVASEIVHRLVNDGFAVKLTDDEVRRKAIEGDYAPSRLRRITTFTTPGGKTMLRLLWPSNESFFETARTLPGARWAKPGVAVPLEAIEAAVDFADLYGFYIMPKVTQILATYRAAMEAGEIIDRPVRSRDTAEPLTGKPRPLAIPDTVEIDEALRDD